MFNPKVPFPEQRKTISKPVRMFSCNISRSLSVKPCLHGLSSILFVIVCFNISACQRTTKETAGINRFGNPYQIVTNETPASPDILPFVRNDSLYASIGYSGGCETHDFTLNYDIRRDTTVLWIYHDAQGDECEAYVQDRIEVPIPPSALENPSIILLNPEGGTPFILRWGLQSTR